MKKIFFLLLTLILLSSTLFSQKGGMISLQWNMAVPTGQTNDFVGNISLKGVNLDYRLCIKPNIYVGARAAWNVFYEDQGWKTVSVDNNTMYSNYRHYINTIPVMLSGGYLFNSRKFVPYAGLNLGAYYITSKNLAADGNAVYQNAVHFGVAPEIGISIPFIISNFGLNITTRYNWAIGMNDVPGYSWVDASVGISFMY
jgi:hypothetical protein